MSTTNYPIYDDGNFNDLLDQGMSHGTGRVERDYKAMPVGCSPYVPVRGIEAWPMSKILDVVRERKAAGAGMAALRKRAGYQPLNQQQTSFCWANAAVNCYRMARAMQNEPYVDLSPASVAAPIRGYRNQGGLGIEAVPYIAEHGVCTTDLWPANAIDRRLDNPKSQANRANYVANGWFEAVAQNDGQGADVRLRLMYTLALLYHPQALGYAWWGHEVMGLDVVEVEPGSLGILIENSWGTGWGEGGLGVLRGSQAVPMDIVVLDTASAGMAVAA
jgi:hypothetical protein